MISPTPLVQYPFCKYIFIQHPFLEHPLLEYPHHSFNIHTIRSIPTPSIPTPFISPRLTQAGGSKVISVLTRITGVPALPAPLRLRVIRSTVAALTSTKGVTRGVSTSGKRKSVSSESVAPANKRARMEGGKALELGGGASDSTNQLATLLLAMKGEGVRTVYLPAQALGRVVHMLVVTPRTESLLLQV